MKVCLLNVLHEPDDKRVFQKIARSLLKDGHDVTSIGPCLASEASCSLRVQRLEGSSPHPGPLPRGAEGEGTGRDAMQRQVTLLTIPSATTFRQRLLSVIRLVREGRRIPADVYYAPEPESWVAALVLKLLTRRRVVFDMHEHVPSEFAKFFPRAARPFMEWFTLRIMRLFARYTDLIILTRESFAPIFAGLRVPRVTVINTNHLQPKCANIPPDLLQKYANRPTIIHQGIFGDVRGSYQLVEAMKLLVREFTDLRCILLGRYEYGSEADYRRAIEAAGLTQHMELVDVVPYDAVPAYIAVAQAGMILFQPGPLNHTLAMPHKLFDYMREAKPVVAPDFAVEVSHIIREADCGLLVDVTSPQAIADGIKSLLKNPEEAKRLGQNGRRIVEEKYNWEAEEVRLLEAFACLGKAR